MGSFISGPEVAQVAQKPLAGLALGVDEIRPGFLNALNVVGLSLQTRLCNVAWTLGAVPLDWKPRVVLPLFKKRDRRLGSNCRGSHSSAFLGRPI